MAVLGKFHVLLLCMTVPGVTCYYTDPPDLCTSDAEECCTQYQNAIAGKGPNDKAAIDRAVSEYLSCLEMLKGCRSYMYIFESNEEKVYKCTVAKDSACADEARDCHSRFNTVRYNLQTENDAIHSEVYKYLSCFAKAMKGCNVGRKGSGAGLPVISVLCLFMALLFHVM